MLFQVEMSIKIPADADPAKIKELGAKEVAIVQGLQKAGTWRHIWRVVGKRANLSIIETKDAEELHDILTGLPLAPYMEVKVVALCRHPASIAS